MSSIAISELKETGLSLFEDQESYLNEVNGEELSPINGASTPVITFVTASSPECAAFTAGIITGASASVVITKAIKG